MKLLEKIRKFFGIKTKEEKERERRFQEKLAELRKRDPFIYHNR